MNYRVRKSAVQGEVAVPTSKSHTMRAVLLASMLGGTSHVHKPLPSPDTAAMTAACRAFGARIDGEAGQQETLVITGVKGNPKAPDQVLDVGNSGQVLRFGAAFAALSSGYTIITGDESIRSLRPMHPLLTGLSGLSAFAESSRGNGYAPVIIRGPAKAGQTRLSGNDSQPVSALLMLAAFLEGATTILVDEPGELPWIDLTLYWLDRLGVSCRCDNYTRYEVQGPVSCKGFDYTVPGDWSSAAFPVAAALVQNAPLTLLNMDYTDPQGDKAVLGAFERMGARFTIDGAAKCVHVHAHEGLHGAELAVNHIIDAVPVLAAVACFASGPTRIYGAEIARHKECDRLHGIAEELGKMGASIKEEPDGLVITPAPLHGAVTHSRHDHRIAMAVTVAALAAGETTILDTACVAKSFPGFAATMAGMGAEITECSL